MAENKLIWCPCSVWPTVLNSPAKVIYKPVKRNTGRALEGWISGLGIATIFHHYQATPGGLVKHLVMPHSPCCWPFFFFWTGTKLKHFAMPLGPPLEGELALFCWRIFIYSFLLQHSTLKMKALLTKSEYYRLIFSFLRRDFDWSAP